MSFPTSPTNGQVTVVNQVSYQYSSATNSWTRILSTANIITANTIAVNGALTVGTTISAVGNITGGNVVAGTVYATNFVTSGSPTAAFRLPNLTQTQIDALSPQNGDMVYNTTTDLSQVYQNGGWNNFTVSYYS